MSYWLGYIVIEHGTVSMAADFHGYSFLSSLADGRDAVLARVAESGPVPYQDIDLEAYEGMVLIDLKRRVLATWNHDATHLDRHDILPAMRRAWPGYDVRWAYGGAADIGVYLGDTPAARDTLDVAGWKPYQTRHQPWDESFFLVTVDAAGYALAVPEPGDLLAGPQEATTLPDAWRIENLAVWWHRDEPVPLPGLGLHLDTVRRTVTGWTVHTVEGIAERWAATWPGWRWIFEHDSYDRHYRRCHEQVQTFLPAPLPGPGWPPLRRIALSA